MTLKKRPSRVAAMPPRVPESDDKTFGRRKVYKASPRWQKSTNRPSQPTSFSLSESLPPCRKARLLRRVRYGTSPGDRYVTPPKTLWHNYTSVALKGEGRRGRGGDRASERSGGVVGAGGCFTPGLFKETAQGMPLALLTKHFPLSPSLSFLPFCFFLSIAGCAPVKSSGPQSSPTAIWGCLRNFLADIWACFAADVSNE